jgi:hypothetical protein
LDWFQIIGRLPVLTHMDPLIEQHYALF